MCRKPEAGYEQLPSAWLTATNNSSTVTAPSPFASSAEQRLIGWLTTLLATSRPHGRGRGSRIEADAHLWEVAAGSLFTK